MLLTLTSSQDVKLFMQVAVVTGGSRGIGRETASILASRGFAVIVNYAGSDGDAAQAVAEIEQAGGRAKSVKADVASSWEVRALFDEAERSFGGIDVVVASAGVMKATLIADTTDEDFAHQIGVNLRGSFNVFREAAKRVRDNGRVIGFSSTTLALNAPGYSVYNATKGAIEGMVRVIAKEVGGRGITVNAVAPGPVETELFMRGKPQEVVERMAAMAPLRRLGRPSDIAGLVAFLASAEAGWINGQIVRANGGIA